MRAEQETRLAVFREKLGARQMDRIERLNEGRHWLPCSTQDLRGQANEPDGTLRRRERLVSTRQTIIIKRAIQTQTVDCAACLNTHQLARIRAIPPAPFQQGVPVAKQRAKYRAGIEINRHRSARSARSSATTSIGFLSRMRRPTGRHSVSVASRT